MSVPVAAHTQQPWRIHEITPDFRVLDVWAYKAFGAGPHDLPVMRAAIRTARERDRDPLLVRFLFAARWKLGKIFGWDDPAQGAVDDGRVTSLCERLPSDLRQPVSGMPAPGVPFTHLYQLDDECAMELANKTVHGVAHEGWVQTGKDEYELRMAILVKANGLFGRAYLASIALFRYLVVYPAMTRQWERAWRDRADLLGEDAECPNGREAVDSVHGAVRPDSLRTAESSAA